MSGINASIRPVTIAVAGLVLLVAAHDVAAAGPSTDFFESKIRPVLIEHCYECHSASADLVQGGLRVDHPQAMTRGGDSGVAVKPGDPSDSLLLVAMRYDGLEMPPDGPLDDRIIDDFEAWIRRGAAMPTSTQPTEEIETPSTIDWEEAKSFWAFQTPSPRITPTTAVGGETRNQVDSFILARLNENELHPNGRADRHTWIRRVWFDLVGLPPSFDEVQRFLQDDRPDAKRRVVDQLLSSPVHAEHWARLWLDIARYAEDQAHIVGNNDSLTYPNAHRYRQWVIEALAADMPYDEFVRMQLAADLLCPDDPQMHSALGFIGLGPKYYRRGDLEVMADEWEDRVDVVSRGLIGLTVACARCHDHKYDPIPTSDYYAMAGIFASTEMFNRPIDGSVELAKDGQAKRPADAVHIIREGTPRDLNIMIRGDAKRSGPLVPRGFLTVLSANPEKSDTDALTSAFSDGSGRVALAEAITSEENPLAARVIVNRVWRRLMGNALVDTPSNFGALGSRPTHPELLDDLSARFMRAGWSLKWLQKELVLSATYGQCSDIDSEKAEVDPDNRLYWRMPRRRLSVEAYRDAILHVTGNLETQMGGPSIQPDDPNAHRRTVYAEVSRLDLNPMMARFDFPDPNAHSAGRHETNTPLQKLFLLNSPFMLRNAQTLANQVRNPYQDDVDRVRSVYRRVFARDPLPCELALATEFVAGGRDTVWEQFTQTLLISNEMFMVD